MLCASKYDELLAQFFGMLYTAPRKLGRKAQGALMTPEHKTSCQEGWQSEMPNFLFSTLILFVKAKESSEFGLEYERRTLMTSRHKRLDTDSRPRRPMRRLCPKFAVSL